VDGYQATSSSNTVSDVIPGVTLNLQEAAPDTTITLSVGRDLNSVTNLINNFVNAYNTVMDAINTQQTYNTTTNQPGGPLFGDTTLQNIKYNLRDTILSPVSGVNPDLSTLGLIGISIGTDGKLTVDNTKLQGYLQTNFNDVENLFISNSSSTNSSLTYVGDTNDTQPGTYNVQVTGVSPVAGYFVNQGDASGSGNTLTGTSGNAKGLSVNYSGTATGSVGSMTLTFGVAELLDRALYGITDPNSGYLPDAEQTIQDSITNYTQQITKNQNQITQQMNTLQNQFVTMETTLSQLSNESNWLTGQINSVSNGWILS
jgi:flagellar hook-associated protein 2